MARKTLGAASSAATDIPSRGDVLGLPLALTGATAATRYVGGTASVAPTTGTFAVGDFVPTAAGGIFICTGAGSPGTWVAVGGGGSSVPAPVSAAALISAYALFR